MTEANRPLYVKIVEDYKRKIVQGELKVNERLPSEIDVARIYGVSRITSKRALEELEREGFIYRIKGSGSYVSERKTEDDIPDKSLNMSAVQEVARWGNSSRINVVALVMPFGGSLGKRVDLIQGVSTVLNSNGFYLKVHISHFSSEEEREIINNLISEGVAGIILYPFSDRKNIDLINKLLLEEYPIITIDKYFDALPISCVLSDNFKGSYMAASHLIELGHRDIIFVSDRELDSVTSVRDRYLGFCKALKDNCIELKSSNLICIDPLDNEVILDALQNGNSSCRNLLDPIRKIIYRMLNSENTYTAIHALHDYLAIYLLKVALEMGVKVPDELSIIGFDNIENCSYVEVPLTTMEQNFHKIGEEAGKLIIDKINNTHDEYKRVVLPVKLIKRSSTARISPLRGTQTKAI